MLKQNKFIKMKINAALYYDYVCDIDVDTNSQDYNSATIANALKKKFGRKMFSKNKSGYKGVIRKRDRWVAQISHNGRNIHCGAYDNVMDAARAYNKKAIELKGANYIINDDV